MPEKKPSQKPKKVLNLLDELSPEDLAKINEVSTKGAYLVDQEWLLLTEFAVAFGWQAYLDVKEDKIGTPEMLTLIAANRKLKSATLYQQSLASFIGAGSAQSKNPSQTFSSLTKSIIKEMKADE